MVSMEQVEIVIDPGRDSYINFDNGGMYRGFNLFGQQKFQRGSTDRPKTYRKPTVTIAGMPIHYPSDGTGRDTYIIVDQGGLGLVENRKKRNYLKSLRAYSNRDKLPKSDIYMSSQFKFSPFNQPALNQLNISQRQLSSRLSQPKLAEDPYKEMRETFRKSLGKGSWTSRAPKSKNHF